MAGVENILEQFVNLSHDDKFVFLQKINNLVFDDDIQYGPIKVLGTLVDIKGNLYYYVDKKQDSWETCFTVLKVDNGTRYYRDINLYNKSAAKHKDFDPDMSPSNWKLWKDYNNKN